MVFFGLEADNSKEVLSHVDFVRGNDAFKDYLHGRIATRVKDDKVFVFVRMSMAKLPWWIMGLLSIVVGYFFTTGVWAYVLASVFLCVELLYSKYLWYAIFRLGMRKKGVPGKKRLMSTKECLEWLA